MGGRYDSSRVVRVHAATLMDYLQADNGCYEGEDKEEAPESGRLAEYEDTYQHRAYGSDACPDGVGGADGDSLDSLGQEYHAQNVEYGKCHIPQHLCAAGGYVGLAEAEGEAAFKQAS